MSLDDLISEMEGLEARMELVKDGDFVMSSHPNLLVDWIGCALEACKMLYQMFKDKTGRTLPDVEGWLSMAETRYGFARKVKFGDVVLPRDHNIIIDVMKPLELALQKIEENL